MSLRGSRTAPEPTRTYRYERLNNLVSRALAIRLGLHKAGQAVTLIGFQHMEGQRHHESRQDYHRCGLLPANSTQKQPHDGDRDVSKRRSQVGLSQYQKHGNTHDRARLNEIWPGQLTLVQVGKVFSDRQNQDELHPLGWLEMSSTGHLDPAARSQIFL